MNIKELVKNNFVKFDSYRQGIFYYILRVSEDIDNYKEYIFQVPLDDIGNASLINEDKAITFMRWIRKAIDSKTLIEIWEKQKDLIVEKID